MKRVTKLYLIILLISKISKVWLSPFLVGGYICFDDMRHSKLSLRKKVAIIIAGPLSSIIFALLLPETEWGMRVLAYLLFFGSFVPIKQINTDGWQQYTEFRNWSFRNNN